MVGILKGMIKTSRENVKAINLYVLHNDASKKNNLLNGHSNEPLINGWKFVIPPLK